MKTTIEVPDDLFLAAKQTAAARGETLKDLFTMSLRMSIDLDCAKRAAFHLRDASVDGQGLAHEMDWTGIRETIYEGRGAS